MRGASWEGLNCTLKSVCQRAVEKRVKTILLLRQIETVRLPNHETLQHTASLLHCDGLRMKFQERLVLKDVLVEILIYLSVLKYVMVVS